MNLTKYICPHRKKYFNKRSGHFQYTDCGNCDVCQSKLNARNYGILEQANYDYRYKLFISLTYDNEHLPIAELRYDRQNDVYKPFILTERCKNLELYGSISNDYKSIEKMDRFFASNHCPGAKEYHRFGFIYYKDVQDFFKRIRINFYRQYGKQMSFKYFVLCEYGAKYFRPHYHLIVFSNDRDVQDYFFRRYHRAKYYPRKFVLEDWKFGFADCQLPENESQVSSYVGAYVASIHRVNEILSFKAIKPTTKKSSRLANTVPFRLLDNKDIYLSMSPQELKNLSIEYPLERVALFDDSASFNRLFPKIPILSTRYTHDIYSILKNFRRVDNETTQQLIDRNSNNEYFMFYYNALVRKGYDLYGIEATVENVNHYVINAVRRISIVANHYSSMISDDFIQSYNFIKKLEYLWHYYEKTRLITYFSILQVLPYPCYSILDSTEDYYSKLSYSIMHDKQLKALQKKKHNDKVHKSN